MTAAPRLEQPQPLPPVAEGSLKSSVITVAAGTLAMATVIIGVWEGRSNEPYRDIVGIWTVCDGQTNVAMRRYTDAECDAMLAKSIQVEYAPAVYKCVPALRERKYEGAAAISLTYNIGSGAFCRSTVARRFNNGDWRGGCNAFSSWVYAGGRKINGLVNRRKAEVSLCLKGTMA